MEFVYKHSPAYLVNVLSKLFNQALAARLAPHQATPAQLPVLLSLWQKDGQTQSELCRRMRIEQPTLANTLSRMVRDKLVRKVPDSNDRRQVSICLTRRGNELKPVLTSSALEVHATAMRGLTDPGLETMLMMLTRIIANLDADLNENPLVLDESVIEPLKPEIEATVEPQTPTLDPTTAEADIDSDTLILRDIDIVQD